MRKPAQSKGVKTQRKTSLFRAGFCISRTVLRNAISELEQEITANTEESFADTYFVKGGGLKKTLLENLAKFIAEKRLKAVGFADDKSRSFSENNDSRKIYY